MMPVKKLEQQVDMEIHRIILKIFFNVEFQL